MQPTATISAVPSVPPTIIAVAVLDYQCAWCLAEAGQPAGEGSHGICTRHEDEILQRARERRARKQSKH
jgi:hypothetical protein